MLTENDHVNAIVPLFERMDIKNIDAHLKRDSYRFLKKEVFISKLTDTFEQFKASGDTELIPFKGACGSEDIRKHGFTFRGNKSHNYLVIVFKTYEGIITELCECGNFNTGNIELNSQFYIDEFGPPF